MKKWFCFILAATALSDVFSQNLFAAKAKGSYGFIDPTGHWVIPATFEDAEAFNNGYARIKKSGHWSYIDKDKGIVTGFRFDKAYNFEGEVARVGIMDEERRKITYGLINTRGQ